MKAVVTTGNGGVDRLVYRDVPVPEPAQGEVLIRIAAAGINNTDINTRLGWYSPSVTSGTAALAVSQVGSEPDKVDGGWSGATPFPLIQGTDCCGVVVEATGDSFQAMIGKRVVVRPCMRTHGFQRLETKWMAADFDGAFAQYVKVPGSEVFPVDSDWSDAELAALPCAYGTAENMLHRARLGTGEHVLITGASGGVGSAAIQLARRRGARVTAVAGGGKAAAVMALGCDRVLIRGENVAEALGDRSVDLAIDNVAGPDFPQIMRVLKRGGRYVSSGAIGGPIVTLDMRSAYLNDITMIFCTAWDEPVFGNIVGYVERKEIRVLVAKCYDLNQIVEAQQEFLEKRHVGKLILVPPA